MWNLLLTKIYTVECFAQDMSVVSYRILFYKGVYSKLGNVLLFWIITAYEYAPNILIDPNRLYWWLGNANLLHKHQTCKYLIIFLPCRLLCSSSRLFHVLLVNHMYMLHILRSQLSLSEGQPCEDTMLLFFAKKVKISKLQIHISMVSCQKGPTYHAYASQIGPFWQDTLDIEHFLWNYTEVLQNPIHYNSILVR